jgi:hypothetical protein
MQYIVFRSRSVHECLWRSFIHVRSNYSTLLLHLWHLPDARLARLSPQSVLLLGYHVFWAAARVTMERQRPLQTLHNQFFRERLQIDMAACSATLVGLSAATKQQLKLVHGIKTCHVKYNLY